MALTFRSVPLLADNYAWLITDRATGALGIVDPAEFEPIAAAVDRSSGRLDLILLTHHHADHIAGAEALRRRYGAQIAGARADQARLPPLDLALAEGETVALGRALARVIATPGHTQFHLSYFFADPPVVFCGDALFSLGCGRLFEGSPEDLFTGLAELAALPPETEVCCGHEYSAANARFALSVDPANPALRARAAEIQRQRAAGAPTVPVRLADELAANPFLRARDAASLGALRAAKDRFRG